jgi:hypothetical protein
MKHLVIACLFFCSTLYAKDQITNPAAVLQGLHVGQKVSLSDKGGMYKVDVLDEGEIGTYQVTELTSSHLGVIDIVGMTTTRIPVTSISAVSFTNTKKFVKR